MVAIRRIAGNQASKASAVLLKQAFPPFDRFELHSPSVPDPTMVCTASNITYLRSERKIYEPPLSDLKKLV